MFWAIFVPESLLFGPGPAVGSLFIWYSFFSENAKLAALRFLWLFFFKGSRNRMGIVIDFYNKRFGSPHALVMLPMVRAPMGYCCSSADNLFG